MSVALRPFLPSDGAHLARLFQESVEVLTEDDYSESQRVAWSSAADDLPAFVARLAGALTLVASIEGAVAGFASLQADKIDMLYVHPEYAGQGVATSLVDALEKLARARNVAAVTADVSDTARDFFANRGYVAQQRNSVSLQGEWLANTTMKKTLQPAKAQ
jgi:putative acetyltransferase